MDKLSSINISELNLKLSKNIYRIQKAKPLILIAVEMMTIAVNHHSRAMYILFIRKLMSNDFLLKKMNNSYRTYSKINRIA